MQKLEPISFLLRALLATLGSIPFNSRQSLGRGLGRLLALLPLKEKQIIKLQTQLFLKDRKPNPAEVFGAAATTFMEAINLNPVLVKASQKIACSDWPMIKELLAKDTGLVALTAHYSNWELLAAYMVQQGVPLTVIGREAHSRLLQRELAELRERYQIKTIWRTSHIARTLVHDLKHGRVCAALLDQDTRVQSIPVNFFGEPAQTPVSLIHLAKRLGVEMVSAFIRRLPNGQFTVCVESLDSSLTAEEILQTFHNRLEREILLAPEQWVWFHKRWRTDPNGQRKSSKEYIEWLRSRLKHDHELYNLHKEQQK